LNTIAPVLDEPLDGNRCVISCSGRAGIGKSRVVHEAAMLARRRGVEVFARYCESHTDGIAFDAIAGLLRAALGVDDLGGGDARARVRAPCLKAAMRACCCWMTCWASWIQIGAPTLTIGLPHAALAAKCETTEMADELALAHRVIALADGNHTAGILACVTL
jgi:hypothetical protein